MKTITFDDAIYRLVPIDQSKVFLEQKNRITEMEAQLAAQEPSFWRVEHKNDTDNARITSDPAWAGIYSANPDFIVTPLYVIPATKTIHDSDCSIYNEPAYPAGPCSCKASVEVLRGRIAELEAKSAAQAGQAPVMQSCIDAGKLTDEFCEDNCVSLYETEDCFAHAAVEYVLSKLPAPPAPANSIAIDPQSILDGMSK